VYRAFGDSQGVVFPKSDRRAKAPALCRLIRLGRRAFSIVAHAGILGHVRYMPPSSGIQLAPKRTTQVALLKMSGDFGFSQILPAFRLSEPLPAIFWMKNRLLTA
jgi:hypothetical protein